MELVIILLLGIAIGAIIFKKESRDKAIESIKHAFNKDKN